MDVQVLPNTSSLDDIEKILSEKEKDSQKTAYFQVVSVQPYFTLEELDSRPSLFQQKFNLSRNWQFLTVVGKFISETPFTKSGGSAQSDDVRDQFKRKKIFKTEKAFPYLKKRLRVIDTEEVCVFDVSDSDSCRLCWHQLKTL